MKKKKRIVALFLAGVLLLLGETRTVRAEVAAPDYEAEALAGMKLVAQNESLELYFDEVETDVAVRDKRSGDVWFSNPVDTELDTVSSGYYQRVLKSQLVLTYINENTQISTMNNYDYSILDGQFETEVLEDGIRITYTIGEATAFLLLPEAITQERMEQFLERMSDSQKRKVNRNYILYNASEMTEEELDVLAEQYPAVRENSLYVLRGGVKDYLKEELAGYFEEAGYTQEDFDLDEQNIGARQENDSVWFQVPLTYRLEGDTLLAVIDPEEVSYNDDGYYLVGIDLLRYFGASLRDDGYLFVPDGSGALIYFNNGKTTVSSYGAQVYGQDRTMIYTAYYESQIDARNTVKMPVFGIKDGDRAMFAVIEDGDANAVINAEISGKTTGYNDVYASFSYLQYGSASLDDMVGANSYYMYSKPEFEGTLAIRYAFLSGEKANYSGMAQCYREYLIRQGVLGEKHGETALPFYAEYLGAIDRPKTILGVKYTAVEAVTTFAQAKEISDRLIEGGVLNLNIVYSGWMNGGLHGTAATKCRIVSGLSKGGMNHAAFQDYAGQIGADLYMTVDLQYVYKEEWFDGYSAMKYAPRYFDNTNIRVIAYGLASRVSEGALASLIRPGLVERVAGELQNTLKKKNISGVNVGTLSWELYSDLADSSYTDRQMAKNCNTAAMEGMREESFSLIGDNANAYAWEYTGDLLNVPLYSNQYMILDEDVPFYEMVIHGYIPYAGSAFNLADDYETAVLKSVESGAGLNFKWIYADNSVVKETEFDDLYSVNYEAWIDRAVETYGRVNAETGYLSGVEMVSHERVQREVVKVTYADGSVVYVNYTNEAVTVDGILVDARDFAVRKNDV
ncbi:MAG: DUF5696 domain-containing protein [Clostridium sp.]|nr:DUF5696 domain-containing protein [Clostridium sp.]